MINVLIISDIKIYCEGLSQVLSKAEPIRIVSAVKSLDEAVAFFDQHTPDVVLLEMTIKNCTAIVQLVSTISLVKVIALSVSEDEGKLIEYAEAGINGYISRDSSIEDLVIAIKSAHQGECFCPPKIAACILKKIKTSCSLSSTSTRFLTGIASSASVQKKHLTSREQQIAMLLGNGLSNKQIAKKLTIEVSTVKNHVHSILVKLDVKNRTQAVSQLQYYS